MHQKRYFSELEIAAVAITGWDQSEGKYKYVVLGDVTEGLILQPQGEKKKKQRQNA